MKSSLFGGPRRGGGPIGGNNSAGGHSNQPSSSNNGGGASDRAKYRMEDEEEARRENEKNLDGLSSDLGRLRREAEFLRGEVASQNELIDTVQNFMIGARDGIVGSVGKLDQTMKRFGVKHTLLFAVGMCGAFFVVVYLIKSMLFGSGGAAAAAAGGPAGSAAAPDAVAKVAGMAAQQVVAGLLLPDATVGEAPPMKVVLKL